MASDYESTRISLAANLVRLRAQRGWSQQEAANAANIDLKHFQKLEYSLLNPSLRTLVSVALAFGVPVGRLLHRARPVAKRPVGRPPGSRRKL
jgi:transcriptional regulator with XRE-family HTH domain